MEKKDIKQFLHLYMGCEVSVTNIEGRYTKVIDYDFFQSYYDEDEGEFLNDPKICLRPLSSMTEEEALHVAWFNMDSEKHLDKDARISKDEINANVVYNDGGLLVDEDAAVIIDLTCRCFEGQVCIRNNGDIEVWNDSGEKLPIERQSENFRYLLSKGFDLFGLIESGLAIDSTLKPV